MNISIISSSVRTGRRSHRVALFFKQYLLENYQLIAGIIDLNEYKFPVFEERLKNIPDPTSQMLDFSKRVKESDGIILVTPEYNGGYPASLKNAIDLLYPEWKRKPVALTTVSDGVFGGSQVTTSLVFSMWKIGMWVVPAKFPVPKVEELFDESGVSLKKDETGKRAKIFVDELIWCVNAAMKMKE